MSIKKLSLEEATDFLFELPNDLSEISDLEDEDDNLDTETYFLVSPLEQDLVTRYLVYIQSLTVLNCVSHQMQPLKHLLMIM